MKDITGHTQIFGLLGTPVAHSISPQMHNEAFRQLDMDCIYLAFDVGTDNMKRAVDGLRALNVRGYNVTMPNKNMMATLCDQLSPAAKIIGAVNTVVNDNDMLIGHNTDGIGYMRAVEKAGHNIINKKMTLLGAGGASTAVLVQAALDGLSEISVFSRSTSKYNERAKNIIENLKKHTTCKINLYDLADEFRLKNEINESVILTNGTSVGMAPNTESSLINDPCIFHKDLIVSDIIYNPRETKLMKLAKQAGCQTFNGLDMLLYQGAEAFKIWTGQDMPVDIIKAKYFS